MIRITGGKNRSRKLITPDTDLTKPTMDKVRAAVFNALTLSIVGLVKSVSGVINFLDLFLPPVMRIIFGS